MKCSLKDSFISILLIILIAPSKGMEFPLLLQKNTVLDKPMNFQQFKAAINKLQDLDSFPDVGNSESKLHKIVKKQMAASDSQILKKSKRSTLSVFNLSRNYVRAARHGKEIARKGSEKIKNGRNKLDHFYGDFQGHDSKIAEEILAALKDMVKDKQLFSNNRLEKKILFQKLQEKKERARCREYLNHVNSALKEYNAVEKSKSALKEHPKFSNTAIKGKSYFDKAKLLTAKTAVKGNQYSANAPVKEKQSFDNPAIKEAQNTANAAAEEKPSAATNPKIQMSQTRSFLKKKFTRIPDEHDFRYYYECEKKPFGCANVRRERCPEGQFFSYECLKCLKTPASKEFAKSKRTANNSHPPKKIDVFDNTDDPEPANEWMDANQGSVQKIPPEFKPKKTPGLKIYHLCSKRKMKQILRKTGKRHVLQNSNSEPKEPNQGMTNGIKSFVKRRSSSKHHPRSFVIHIKKKEGKENQDQSITESDETDEDEENDEDDDDEDGEDEDDEAEEEAPENLEEKSSRKDALKEFFKSAKAAVTNRARFNDPSLNEPEAPRKESNLKTKNSEENTHLKDKSKKVLLDANIKVDSTIGSALKYILKSKTKDKESRSGLANEEKLTGDRGSQDQLDPELTRTYERLISNNPNFLANCSKGD